MQVWRIDIGVSEDEAPARQGYALATSASEARFIAAGDHGYPVTIVHEKHPATIWPGKPGANLHWVN